MDPLKMAYGVKKPLEEKVDMIKGLPQQHKRYYPVDQHGNLDEWGAVTQHQKEVYDREKQQNEYNYRINQSSYHTELDKVVRQHHEQGQMEKVKKEQERDLLLQSL